MISGPIAPPSCAHRRWLLALLVLASGATACSSQGRKDQNYGKDVGIVYEPPEGGTVSRDGGAADGGASEAGAADARGADGGAEDGDAPADDAG